MQKGRKGTNKVSIRQACLQYLTQTSHILEEVLRSKSAVWLPSFVKPFRVK